MHPQLPSLTAGLLCWRNLITLLYFVRHFIPRWILRSIFAQFTEQLLKDLVYIEEVWRVFHDRLLLPRVHIVDLFHYYVCCMRSGVTRCTLFMMLFSVQYVPVRRYTHALPHWRTYIAVPQNLYSSLSVLWDDFTDPVFDGVGLTGFKNGVNSFSLVYATFCLLFSLSFFQ